MLPKNTDISTQYKNFDIEVLSKELRELEEKLMPQLEELGNKLPQIYANYAKMARHITSELLRACDFSESTSGKIALAAELGSRAIESYGSYKAAKKHNQLLSKFIETKCEIARLNSAKVKRLIPESDKNLFDLKRLFDLHVAKNCKFSDVSQENMSKVANIQLRVLNLYRSSLFINKIAKYLDMEYQAWNEGKQTSGAVLPDYYATNSDIATTLWGDRDKTFEAIESAADATEALSGKEIILLSDKQLFIYAIGDELCNINIGAAQPHVKELLSLHNGLKHYLSISKQLKEHISANPTACTRMICLATWAAIVCMAIWYLPGSGITRTLIAIAGCIAIFKIGKTAMKKIKKIHFVSGDDIIEEYVNAINRECGKVEDVKFDYEEKNALSSAFQTFITSKS